MGILIQGGRIVDAATDTDKKGDIYLEDGVITEIGEKLKIKDKSDRVIDAKGCLVMPGLIDLHVHFRDPGQTQKEDIETGSRAAARGGVTTVVAMPNTTPVIDSPDRVNYVHNKAKQLAGIHVLQAGAITQGEKGQELSDIEGMVKAGIPALSEDGKSVMNTRLCKEAMEVAEKFNVPIFAHCEDIDLRGDGCMNEDENARRLGLPGICNAVEDVIAARDILLARETGARLHLCHCSTEGVAKMMEIVKEEGLDNITAEVCPHHFILTSDDIKCDDPNYKMNPPLRTKKDVDALIRGLKDGSFKVISTDHAPHAVPEKTGSIRNAAFGIVGIETSFALSYTALVETGILTISQLIEKMSWNPAQILGSDRGTLQKGHPADIVIADIDHEYKIDKKNKYNLCAFRKCYGLDENTPVIINFGVYNPDNGFNDYESLARIMPDVEFFFFGARNGLFNASEHYNKASSLTNLHYEEMLPYELYDSAICTTSAIVLTGQFHVESVILHEAMNNGLPIISAKNGMLFDLLINDKTATIVDSFDSLYNAVVNINKNEVILDNAKELTNTFDYEKKGQALKEMYEKIIEESN